MKDSCAADISILLLQQGRWKGCKEQESDSPMASYVLLASAAGGNTLGLMHLCFNLALLGHCWEERRLLSARCLLPPRRGRDIMRVELKEVKWTNPGSPLELGVKWPFCLTFLPGIQPSAYKAILLEDSVSPLLESRQMAHFVPDIRGPFQIHLKTSSY